MIASTIEEFYSHHDVADQLKNCPIEVAFKILGKRWTVQILREMFKGVTQFNRFHENIKGINSRMLSLRLRELQRLGFIKKNVVSEHPLRAEYELTDLGRPIERVLVEAAFYSMRRMPKKVFKEGKPENLEQVIGAEAPFVS